MQNRTAQAPVVEVDVRDSVEYLAGLTVRQLVKALAQYRAFNAVRGLLPAELARMRRIEQVLRTKNGEVPR